MTSSEVQVANLLYRYAEYIDGGDFKGAASLFEHAKTKFGDKEIGPAEVLAIWEQYIIMYPDGTPRTKHIISNPIIEVDEQANKATIRSYYTVMHGVDGVLQPVACGRYHDWFERVNGTWRWSFRDYNMNDMHGDMSKHTRGFAK